MTISVDEVSYELHLIFDSSLSDIQRIERCRNLVNTIITTWSPNLVETLKEVVEFFAQDDVHLFVSRQMLSDFCLRILPWLSDSQSKIMAQFMRKEMQPRAVHFEFHLSIVCNHLSCIYEKEENWKEAANLLASIPAESYYRFSVDFELELYMKIARLYMEDDEPLLAEPYVKKASVLQFETTNNDLHLNYKVCYARMLNFRLKFIEAALEYHELSNCQSFGESERLIALKNALVCTILSFTGNYRTQLLKLFFNDERCKLLIRLKILKNLYMVRFIKPNEINEIETMLMPHQKAKTIYGTTLLIEAIAEHNIQSIRILHQNIKIESFANLLGFHPYEAKLIAARMIFEGRIEGSIDEANGLITFNPQKPDQLQSWHKKIESMKTQLNRMNELLLENSSVQKVEEDQTDV
ncbi:COP9 signalosome complex subunit 4-like [Metopolophium dirhodum]|uniref:COP9 signalosome complex subunit 4-like n=1 Tax=Metopolophium dirhodum TaxID=44670 RepID=UPI00299006DD|nr:COP9 signalosome complex subunit 4-like [Metopolophium dirhodum]XP_060856125.1 COP9 signalosome complex subunit 4-like [Metopolophium dirhodum]